MPEGFDLQDALDEQNGTSNTLESSPKQEVVTNTTETEVATEAVENTESAKRETPEVVDVPQTEEVNTEAEVVEQQQVNAGSEIIDLESPERDSEETGKVAVDAAGSGLTLSEMLEGQFETTEALEDRFNQLESMEQEFNDSKNKDPEFANDFVKQLNDVVKRGGDPIEFAKIQGVDVNDLTPIDAIKMDLKWKYGLTDAEADSKIKQKYSTGEEDPETGDPIINTIDIKIDAKDARDNIKSRQADNTLPEVVNGDSREDWESEVQSRVDEEDRLEDQRMMDSTKGWMPKVDVSMKNLQDKGFIMPIGQAGKAFRYSYDGDESYTKSLTERADQALYDSGMNASENPELAETIVNNLYFMENRGKIMNAFAEQVRSVSDEHWFKEVNNSSAIKRGDKVEDVLDTPSVEKQMEDIMRE